MHRIGRTARAGAEGIAISFCDNEEVSFLRDIEKLIQTRLPRDRTAQRAALRRGTASPAAENANGRNGNRRNGQPQRRNGGGNGHNGQPQRRNENGHQAQQPRRNEHGQQGQQRAPGQPPCAGRKRAGQHRDGRLHAAAGTAPRTR